MMRVKGRDTRPELIVRSAVHRMGYRFRVQRRDLPGKPDMVLPRHRKVIFVNGCFWHGHEGCRRSKRPTTNVRFWSQKLDRNIERDRLLRRELRAKGWKVLVVWQCETRRPETLRRLLARYLDDK
jgi:DNA mismatch endonuclease (patch repair protein)